MDKVKIIQPRPNVKDSKRSEKRTRAFPEVMVMSQRLLSLARYAESKRC
jgi:hypothetical protein